MKKVLILCIAIIAYISANAQTFVVSEMNNYPGISQDGIKKNQKLIGQEVTLTFTDNDVRLSISDDNGGYQTELLEKKGNNIYRKNTSESGSSYDEIQLDTFLGYIRGFTFTHYHQNNFGGGFKAKRKFPSL